MLEEDKVLPRVVSEAVSRRQLLEESWLSCQCSDQRQRHIPLDRLP